MYLGYTPSSNPCAPSWRSKSLEQTNLKFRFEESGGSEASGALKLWILKNQQICRILWRRDLTMRSAARNKSQFPKK
jgi:hypothetical protein